jgi:hypothetical protein
MPRRPTNSAVAIAKLLSAEGFTDELVSAVKRWWKRSRMSVDGRRRIARHRKAFSDMVRAKLDERDKIVLGKAMGILARMNFDAGLTIGLQCLVQEHGREVSEIIE